MEWADRTKLFLSKLARGETPPPETRDAFAELRQILEAWSMEQIQDDTPWRAAEKWAWFRLFEKLSGEDGERSEDPSAGRVGYLSLFRQPEVYRGRLVTVRGTARLAYRVQAPPNALGIKQYYVFWLRPSGGPNTPLVIYALETPAGFPALPDKDLEAETSELDEDIECTGYFFKRWAYRAHDGLNTTPLVITHQPRWLSSSQQSDGGELPSASQIAVGVLAMFVVAMSITLWVYRATRGSRRWSRVPRGVVPADATVPPVQIEVPTQDTIPPAISEAFATQAKPPQVEGDTTDNEEPNDRSA
jgi:hypothetical protein